MFGIGTWEWVLIIIIALVFLGPDKLPEVARSAGKGLRAVRKAMRGLEDEMGPMTDLDPRRVFDDALRHRPRDTAKGYHAGASPTETAPRDDDSLPLEDVAPATAHTGPTTGPTTGHTAGDDREPGGGPNRGGAQPGIEPSMEMEPDGRVAAGPPLARPAPTAKPVTLRGTVDEAGAPAADKAPAPEAREEST